MIRRGACDPTLYLVTDPVLGGDRPLEWVVEQAMRGGVTCVQYRDKDASTRKMVDQARKLREVCHRFGVTFIVNDRVDVALAAEADGVHLGDEDMRLEDARRLLGDAVVGVSVRTVEQARQAQEAGATYVAVNGVWATPTKTDFGEPLGPAMVREIVKACSVPVVAIGGINERTVEQVAATGCHGIAVVSAVMAAESPEKAAAELKRKFLG